MSIARRKPHAFCLVVLAAAIVGAAAPLKATERWPYEEMQGPLRLHANFPLDEHQRLIGELPELQRDLMQDLGLGQAQRPIFLFFFDSPATYRSYVRRHFPEVPYRQAIFIQNSGLCLVYAHRSTSFEVDVRHEFTHAVLHASLPVVPLWLDEGLAEYYEVPCGDRARNNPHLSRVKWDARLGLAPNLRELESLRRMEEMNAGHYRAAWSWVHFMMHGPDEARSELIRYLADLRAHTPPGRLSERLDRQLGSARAHWIEHFRRW